MTQAETYYTEIIATSALVNKRRIRTNTELI